MGTLKKVADRRAPSILRLVVAAALDVAGHALGFALADAKLVVFVVAVVLTVGLVVGTLAGVRLIGIAWLVILLVGLVAQLIPPIDPARIVVAVCAALAAWLVFGHLRATRISSPVVRR